MYNTGYPKDPSQSVIILEVDNGLDYEDNVHHVEAAFVGNTDENIAKAHTIGLEGIRKTNLHTGEEYAYYIISHWSVTEHKELYNGGKQQ